MKADPEGIIRSITWGSPLEEGGNYNWQKISEQLNTLCPSDILMQTLRDTAEKLSGLKSRLSQRGVPKRILTMPVMGFDYLDDKLMRWGLL